MQQRTQKNKDHNKADLIKFLIKNISTTSHTKYIYDKVIMRKIKFFDSVLVNNIRFYWQVSLLIIIINYDSMKEHMMMINGK